MSAPYEPVRLFADATADPRLREALYFIRQDTPSVAELSAFADATERAVREGAGHAAATSAVTSTYSLTAKLMLLSVVCSAMLFGVLQRSQSDRQSAVRQVADARVIVQAPAAPALHAARTAAAGAASAATPGTRRESELPEDARAERIEQPTLPLLRVKGAASHVRRRAHATMRAAAPTQQASRARDVKVPPAQADTPHQGDEVALLESAQQALLRDPSRALGLLAEHRAKFPRGDFVQERDVLELETHQRLHDVQALREGARQFLERYPRSPHRGRVEKLLH